MLTTLEALKQRLGIEHGRRDDELIRLLEGVSAAILALALETIGAPAKALYDGSWAEWGALDECEVVKG